MKRADEPTTRIKQDDLAQLLDTMTEHEAVTTRTRISDLDAAVRKLASLDTDEGVEDAFLAIVSSDALSAEVRVELVSSYRITDGAQVETPAPGM